MRLWLWICFCGALAWLTWTGSAGAAKTSKEPWFLAGQAASERRQEAAHRGVLIRVELLPQLGLETGLLLPFVALEWSGSRLLLWGHADFRWHQQWLPYLAYNPFGSSSTKGISFGDGGSVVRVGYRWKTSMSPTRFHREVSLFWYPSSFAPFQMGEILEALWVFSPPALTLLRGLGRFGVALSWEWLQLESLLSVDWYKAPTSSQLKENPQPTFYTRLRLQPHRSIMFGADGGFFVAGPIPAATGGTLDNVYMGWGVQPMVRLLLGDVPSPMSFLHRRRRDPRSQRKPIAPFRKGRGISLTAELGIKGHQLRHPRIRTDLTWEVAYAVTTRLRGQWDIFSLEFLFHWHEVPWTVFDVPGIRSFQAMPIGAETEGLFLLAAAIGLQVHPTLSVAARVELRKAAFLIGSISPSVPGTIIGSRPQVIFAPANVRSLPEDTEIIVNTSTILSGRWEPWPFASLSLEFWWHVDPNVLRKRQGSSTTAFSEKVVTEHQFGTDLLLQVRFR